MSDLLNIGIRGLMAYQAALNITGKNIMNVNTPYYSRRQVAFSADLYGNGVNISDVRRVFDEAASKNLLQANSINSLSSTIYQQLSQLETVLGDDKNNIGKYIKDSLTQLINLNHDASSVQGRTAYLNMLSTLSGRFSAISSQVNQQQININTSLTTSAGQVNEITQQIAALNDQIANSGNTDISTLLDAREAQIQELSQFLNFSTLTDSTNQVMIMVNNGTALVNGKDAGTLQTVQNPDNPDNLLIMLSTKNTGTIDVTHLISSGQIAGYYDAQQQLQQTLNSLGRLAMTLTNALNTQNKLGMDLNGNIGTDIFNDINNMNAINTRVLPNIHNTGTEVMSVSITNTNQLTTSDYNLVFDTPTHYTLTRVSDNSVVSSGAVGSFPQQISADGFSINLASGSIMAGDKFTISPTRGAASGMSVALRDPSTLALAWPIETSKTLNNQGNGSINITSVVDTTNASFSIPKQLNPPITVHFLSATTYELVNANTSAIIEGPITYNPATGADLFPTPGSYDPGYRVHISGDSIQTNDTFTIEFNTNGTSGNENGLLMKDLYEKKAMENSSLSFLGGYDLLSSQVSLQTNSAKIKAASSDILLTQATNRYQQVSGVSLEEESTYLAQYQEAYQASAQIIAVAKSIFDTIIGIGR